MKNFTIYRLGILNNSKEEQLLSQFNGTNDLLDEFNLFYQNLSKEKIDYFDNNGNKRTFSISSDIEFLKNERKLVSDLDSAYTGEKFKIRNGLTNSLKHLVLEEDLQSRELFSFLHIPKNSKRGYVVFENKRKHGVKIIFEREFNRFLKKRGYEYSKLTMTPGLNFNYLSNMIEHGKLKKIRLINYNYSQVTQLSLFGNLEMNYDGEETTLLKFPTKVENNLYKNELYKFFFLRINLNEKIKFLDRDEVDEISFEINYINSSKTFYLKDKSKMRSNIDVTRRLDYRNDKPTYLSKKRVASELINEILNYKPVDQVNVNIIGTEILEIKQSRAKKNAEIFKNSKLNKKNKMSRDDTFEKKDELLNN